FWGRSRTRERPALALAGKWLALVRPESSCEGGPAGRGPGNARGAKRLCRALPLEGWQGQCLRTLPPARGLAGCGSGPIVEGHVAGKSGDAVVGALGQRDL